MPEGPIIIRCPFCGHPYPMTQTQFDVYRGRNMGCMGCGKPFEVRSPPPPPPVPAALPVAAPVAGGEVPATAGGYGTAGESAPNEDGAVLGGAVAESAARASGAVASYTPTLLDRASVAAGVLFVVLVTVAAIAGYSSASAQGIHNAAHAGGAMVLLRIALICAALAAVGGGAAVWRARAASSDPADRRRRGGHGVAALSLGLAELLIVLLLSLIAWPSMARALGESQRATCQTNLQQIGYLLAAKANNDPNGRFPDSLQELVRSDELKASAVSCPASDIAPAPSGLSSAAQADLIAAGKHISYTYLGKGLAIRPGGGTTRAGSHTVIAYEQPGSHGDAGGLHVLFADGSVVFAEKEQARSLLAELQSGQNPPPTADSLRP